MHSLYVLYSLKNHRLYKGTCGDLPARFLRHNTGGNKSTAHRRPFVLIHVEIFETKKEALAREREVKTLEGGAALNDLKVARGRSRRHTPEASDSDALAREREVKTLEGGAALKDLKVARGRSRRHTAPLCLRPGKRRATATPSPTKANSKRLKVGQL